MKNLARYFALGFFGLFLAQHAAIAQTQPSVRQNGTVTANHVALWAGNNLIKDGGGAAGTGTVTSVGATGDGILFPTTISGSPVTTAGTFSFSPVSQTANLFYASPNGSSGTPTFRAIGVADLPTGTTTAKGILSVPATGGLVVSSGALSLGNPSTTVLGGVFSNGASQTSNEWVEYINNSGTPVLGQINFSNLSGTAAIGQGGTGLTTLGAAFACLQVNAAGTGLQYNAACTGSPTTSIYIGTTGSPNPAMASDATSGIVYSASPSKIAIQAANVQELTVGSTGVAIGTTTLSGLLNISGATPTFTLSDTTSGNADTISNIGGTFQVSVGNSNSIIFSSNGTERMRIPAGVTGLAIGTTSVGASVMAIGTTNFSDTTGTTGLQITGNINNFYQEILQNTNTGANVSADYVAGGNDMTATTHYVDFGKNGSGGGTTPFAAADAAYMFSTDNEFDIGATGTTGTINLAVGATPTTELTIGTAGITANEKLSAPTASALTNTTQVATTAYVDRGNGVAEVLLGSCQTASNSASIQFTSIPSGYGGIRFVFYNVQAATNVAYLNITLSENNGSTWISSNYAVQSYTAYGTGSANTYSASAPNIAFGSGLLNNSYGLMQGNFLFSPLNATGYYKTLTGFETHMNGNGAPMVTNTVGADYYGDTNAVNALEFTMSSGNITSGTFCMYGLRNQ